MTRRPLGRAISKSSVCISIIFRVGFEGVPCTAPAFSWTAHTAQGQTLKAAIVDMQIGRGTSPMSSYVAFTRVSKKEDLGLEKNKKSKSENIRPKFEKWKPNSKSRNVETDKERTNRKYIHGKTTRRGRGQNKQKVTDQGRTRRK